MQSKLVVDELQLLKAIQTLDQNEGKVQLSDVVGVIHNCNSWIISAELQSVKPVIDRSQQRRVIIQLGDNMLS